MSTSNNEALLEKQANHTALPLRPVKQPTFKIISVLLLITLVVLVNYFLFHRREPVSTIKNEDTFEMPHLNTTIKPSIETSHRTTPDTEKLAQQNMQQALAEAKAKDLIERLQASQGSADVTATYAQTSSDTSINPNSNSSSDRENNVLSNVRMSDPNTAFLMQASNSKAEHVYATHFGMLPFVIGQGKFIFANLAVAINSDLPGQMTAIVSQDVYGEQGRKILIPKGSLLIGEYKSGLANHQSRLFVVWTRLREPNGIDVMLGSEGTDALGRAGLTGDVDYHFFARFGSAFLIAMIGAGASTVGVNPNDEYNSAAAYRQNVSQALAQQANNTLDQNMNIPPTINIAQGEKIVVFVNRDLDFSRVIR
ncbi:MAG: TrbI/VirB10 family protein [Gammaproteobacteria bacterium]|nr:TrbI/VirB10 family protein [Gammaproteobacteria bacterium]